MINSILIVNSKPPVSLLACHQKNKKVRIFHYLAISTDSRKAMTFRKGGNMKNIIICLDGTWNKPDEREHKDNNETNVRNLCEILDKENPSAQVVYYDEGVGAHWYDRIRGGISGRGLAKNIREAYYEV